MDGAGGDDEEWADVIEGGPPPRPRRAPKGLLLALAVLAAFVVYAVSGSAGPDDTAASQHAPTPSPSPSWTSPATGGDDSVGGGDRPVGGAGPGPAGARPVAEVVDLPLLDGRTGWELFARGSEVMVRIEPASGRVTRTPVPGLDSSGPVSFVVGADRVIVRPWDTVPGYVVPDDKPARRLPDGLPRGGPVFAGPSPEQVWVQRGFGAEQELSLAGLDGSVTDVAVQLPPDSWPMTSDRRGGVLFRAIGGVYLAGLEGIDRITTGAVLAVGPTRWLTLECDEQARCSSVVVERSTGDRRVLDHSVSARWPLAGTISPDGSTAAVFRGGDSSMPTLHLLDLESGAAHQVDVELAEGSVRGSRSLAWSPDSELLFAATGDRGLLVIDTRDHSVHDFAVELPAVSQLATRF